MLKKIPKKKNKKGVSEMIGYVILISVALGLAVAIFAWIEVVGKSAVSPPVDCPDGTSVYLDSYVCNGNIILSIKNSGRFNVDGVIVKVGNDSSKTPITMLKPNYGVDSVSVPKPGYFAFTGLAPGDIQDAKFFNISVVNGIEQPYGPNINIISIQPYVRNSINKAKINCIGSVVTEPIDCVVG